NISQTDAVSLRLNTYNTIIKNICKAVRDNYFQTSGPLGEAVLSKAAFIKNSRSCVDVFALRIDLHTPCVPQSDIERGTDMEMVIDLE
ncbi:hypothetical protein ABVT39_013911, partial [Epinephelus coioides]